MPDYRLSKQAEQDLITIAQWGDDHHGVERSNAYRDKLIQRFLLLAEHPFLYPSVDHIRPGYRRSVCGEHAIYYQILTDDEVAIMRVLGRQNPDTQLRNDDY